MCPKVPGSLLTYRARAGAPRSIANARRRGAPGVLVPVSVQAVALITALYLLAPPPPQGGGGRGEGAARAPPPSGPKGRARRRAARGGAAPPNEGRGRTTAPGPSEGSPTRRAAPVRRTPNTAKQPSFVEGGRNARTQQNLCFGGFVRWLPPPNFGGGAPGSAPGAVGRKRGGYYDTPPRGDL